MHVMDVHCMRESGILHAVVHNNFHVTDPVAQPGIYAEVAYTLGAMTPANPFFPRPLCTSSPELDTPLPDCVRCSLSTTNPKAEGPRILHRNFLY